MNWLANKETAESKVAVLKAFAMNRPVELHDYITLEQFIEKPDVYDLIADPVSLTVVTSRRRLPHIPGVVLYRAEPSDVMRRPDEVGRNHLVWRGHGVGLDARWTKETLTIWLARKCLDERVDEERGEVVQREDVCHEHAQRVIYPGEFSPRLYLTSFLRDYRYWFSEPMTVQIEKMLPVER